MSEPLYQSQPPTGYVDRADAWINTGTLISRLNFALAGRGERHERGVSGLRSRRRRAEAAALLPDVRTDETSAINKTAVLLGSPAFQQR